MSYEMSCTLRCLFAKLLVYCDPATPRKLWEIFEAPMSEDFNIFPSSEPKKSIESSRPY